MRSAVVVTSMALASLAVAHRLDPLGDGLAARYYITADWSSPVAVSRVDRPSTDAIRDAWQQAPPDTFSAEWAGSLLAPSDGTYVLSTISDDGSWVYVDGRLVVDNGGMHGPVPAQGTVVLARGVHGILVRYVQGGGAIQLDLQWGSAGGSLTPLPSWALAPRRVAFWHFASSAAVGRALAVAQWAWVAALLLWAATAIPRVIVRGRRWLEQERVWPALAWIIAGSLALNVAGIWWGLPGGSWAPDELTPLTVISAAGRGFSHGWFDRYPPFHYYLLTAAFSPLLALASWGRIDVNGEGVLTILATIGRAVSIAAGAGTVIAVYACGARAFGRRAGLFAAAAIALVTPFVYYAKTANLDVPYVFWFAASLVFYLRLLDELRTRDFIGFAVCATLSVVTKDQAYGLYLLTPVVIVHRVWQANRQSGVAAPLPRALLDRRLWAAGAVAVVLFACAHNLPFNWSGFVEHVRYITGGGSEGYREFDRTAGGQIALFLLTLDLLRAAWGWPLFLAAIAGAGLAAFTPSYRRATCWLAVPVASYYVGFVNVVLYNYDRFVLPICVVLALFGGLALDRVTSKGRHRAWRVAGVAAIGAYTILYAATVNVAMIRDSRYEVEEWLAAHVGRGELVGYVFPMQYYPRLERYNNTEITSREDLERERPVYYVLNADYARAEPPDSPIGRVISGLQGGTAGYELVFRFRRPGPFSWLPGAHRDVVGPRTEKVITSALRHINPTYEVFARKR